MPAVNAASRPGASLGFDALRHRAGGGSIPSSSSSPSGWTAATPATMDYLRALGRPPRRRPPRPAVGPHRHRHRHHLQHRPALLDRVRRSGARADRALRLGRRLSRRARARGSTRWSRGCAQRSPEPFEARAYVDTGPVQERVYAQHAGHRLDRQEHLRDQPRARLVDLPGRDHLQPAARARCAGASISAAPARCASRRARPARFVEPGVLDSTRCISYLTIEQRGRHSAGASRADVGSHVYGCDICQEVCPYNAARRRTRRIRAWQPRAALDLPRLAELWRRPDAELREGHEGRADDARQADGPATQSCGGDRE